MYKSIIGMILVSASVAAAADNARDAQLRQHFDTDSNASRIARIGEALSSPCSCSRGEPLAGTKGVIFNCACGSMQCVVVDSSVAGSAQVPRLFCR